MKSISLYMNAHKILDVLLREGASKRHKCRLIITHNFQGSLHRIPKGFRNKAQGCEARATLGYPGENRVNPNGGMALR